MGRRTPAGVVINAKPGRLDGGYLKAHEPRCPTFWQHVGVRSLRGRAFGGRGRGWLMPHKTRAASSFEYRCTGRPLSTTMPMPSSSSDKSSCRVPARSSSGKLDRVMSETGKCRTRSNAASSSAISRAPKAMNPRLVRLSVRRRPCARVLDSHHFWTPGS